MRRLMMNPDSKFKVGDVVAMNDFDGASPVTAKNYPLAVVILPVDGDVCDVVELNRELEPLFPSGWNEASEDRMGEVIGNLDSPKRERFFCGVTSATSLAKKIDFSITREEIAKRGLRLGDGRDEELLMPKQPKIKGALWGL